MGHELKVQVPSNWYSVGIAFCVVFVPNKWHFALVTGDFRFISMDSKFFFDGNGQQINNGEKSLSRKEYGTI